MARNPKASVDIVVNEKPAQRGLQALQDSFTSTIVQMNAAMDVAGKVFGAANAAISAVVDTVSEYVELAMEQERVERRAMAALQSRQTFTRAELDLLQQANAARQQQLGIGDEVQLQLQGTLASMGVQKQQLDAATRAAIGLSDAMGIGLEAAGKVAGKALTGNVAALKEYGIQARSVADAQAQLNALYDVAAANSRTLETRLAVLNANVGDFKEVLGAAVTESGALKKGVDAISSAVLELQGYFASQEGRQAVNGFFSVILDLAGDAINAMLGAYKMVQEMRGKGDRQGVLSRVGGALGLATAVSPFGAIRALVTGKSPLQQAREDLDQLLGRGESRDLRASPVLLALENMADALKKAALAARDAKTQVVGRTGGGGDGIDVQVGELSFPGTLREQDQRQREAIERGFARAMADHQIAITREAADIQRQVDTEVLDQRNDLHRQAFDLRMQTTREMTQAELQAIVEGGKAINEAQAAQMQSLADVASTVTNVVGQAITDLITAWASGADMADMTVGKFAGAIIKQLGMMMVQTGVAALLLAPLALIPGLKMLTGGPQNAPILAAAGLGLTVAGAGAIALGARMGGGGSGAPSVPRGGSASGGGAGSRGFDPMPRGFGGSTTDMAAAPSYTVNVSFGVVGDERRAARMIRDVLERGR